MIPAGLADRSRRLALLRNLAANYVQTAIESAMREYPHFPYFVATGPEAYRLHRELHPAFFGSYDWHSCVEMHWVVVRLLRLFPAETAVTRARETLDGLLTPDAIADEMAFFATPANRTLERPYGWGWLLMLAAELEQWDDSDGRRWSGAIAPLARQLIDAMTAWLPRLTYPQRTGTHPNTAFSLVNALQFARAYPDEAWAGVVIDSARRLFLADRDYPFGYEPSGADFLSPGLCEAVLMAEILDPDDFARWFDGFLPVAAVASAAAVFEPAHVSDPTDGQIAHLHGLNLSRAWAFARLIPLLPPDDPREMRMADALDRHAAASLPFVTGSDYMVEHWLAAYATLLLTA
jgi:hypothetical protein